MINNKEWKIDEYWRNLQEYTVLEIAYIACNLNPQNINDCRKNTPQKVISAFNQIEKKIEVLERKALIGYTLPVEYGSTVGRETILPDDYRLQKKVNRQTAIQLIDFVVVDNFLKETMNKPLLIDASDLKNISDAQAESKSNPSSAKEESSNQLNLSKVFIVHGRDDSAKSLVARFIEKLGLTAIILDEQANSSNTIIEKFEEHSNVGYAIILYTPCDIGGTNITNLKSRARQNVVFEHGYFFGKLGRQRVCALVKDEIDIPSDINGVVYIPLDQNNGWKLKISTELKKAGFKIDLDKLL